MIHAAPRDFQRIPVVDMHPFIHGAPHERMQVARVIADAARNVGFFYIVNHGVPTPLIDRAMRQVEQLFTGSTEEQKLQLAYRPGGVRGYFGLCAEDLDQFGQWKQRGDFKEGFDCGLEAPQLSASDRHSELFHSSNQWPEWQPQLQSTMQQYMQSVLCLSRHLCHALALSLGLQEDFFDANITNPCCTQRMLHYPPGGALGCGAHTDYGCFTVLGQDQTGGLEVQNAAGQWVKATPMYGSFVINLGDMMARWTNGLYKSTVHRVVSYDPEQASHRYSMPFFFNPNIDTPVACLPTCCDKDNPARWQPTTCEQVLRHRYSTSFKDTTLLGEVQ